MSKQQDMHYKETTPEETVKHLKTILNSMGIGITEKWLDESVINTWSLRITINGTSLGANGKGTSKAFAQASAYAELFERYQNDMLGMAYPLSKESQYSFSAFHDELKLTAEQLVSQNNNSYFDLYFKNRDMDNCSISQKAKAFKELQRIDYLMRGDANTYISVPFYSLKNKQITYLPKNVYKFSYGSNGMSAGNSFEEAVVQGISEIIERHVQKTIFIEKPTFPDIPDEYIKKYPYVYEMYSKLRCNDNYTYKLKDCSFGGKYPVAALIIIDNLTGKYGIKLGCHPDYGVAMERTFTEAAQGQDILDYTDRSQIDFYNINVDDEMNVYNTYKVGKGQFPYQMFGYDNTYSFTEVKDVSEMSNTEIMHYMCESIVADGYDILVRDVSYLGFSSVHVIIPGISELFNADDKRIRAYNTRAFVQSLLKEPQSINKKTCKYMIATLEYFLPSILENTLKTYYLWYEQGAALPCSESSLGCIYMIAMGHIMNGEYSKAATRLKSLLNSEYRQHLKADDINMYQVMYYYCTAMDTLGNRFEVMKYLRNIFAKDLCDKVYDLIGDEDNVLVKQYPSFTAYSQSVDIPFSKAEMYHELREKLKEAQENNPIDQMSIKNHFSSHSFN